MQSTNAFRAMVTYNTNRIMANLMMAG